MTFRRNFIATAVAAIAFTAALGTSAQTILKAADVHPPGYPNVVAIENMGKKLEAATNGKFKLQMFPSGVLGGEKEMIEQTQVGAINILRTSLGPLGPVVSDVDVFNMPFVFRNEAHMRAVIDGPIGQEILDKITASPAILAQRLAARKRENAEQIAERLRRSAAFQLPPGMIVIHNDGRLEEAGAALLAALHALPGWPAPASSGPEGP